MKKSNTTDIVITGASSGIGHALALTYAKQNVRLHLTGRNKDRLENVKQSCQLLGADVHTIAIDVTQQGQMESWIKSIPKIDLVIANAGIAIGDISPTDNEYQKASRKIFNVNLDGVLNTIHPAIEQMLVQGHGQIAIISSLAGFRGLPTAPAYSASKNAVKAYGEALTPSLREKNIHLSVICPGFVTSGITDKNRFPMPFIMSGQKAAELIKKRLEKRPYLIAFPWPMYFMSWIFSILPSSIAIGLLSLSKENKA